MYKSLSLHTSVVGLLKHILYSELVNMIVDFMTKWKTQAFEYCNDGRDMDHFVKSFSKGP